MDKFKATGIIVSMQSEVQTTAESHPCSIDLYFEDSIDIDEVLEKIKESFKKIRDFKETSSYKKDV